MKPSSKAKQSSDEGRSEITKRLRLMSDLYRFAYTVKSHQIRRSNPHWTDAEIHKQVQELIEKGCR